MDELRLPAVAARVVAWHNRHPLARRIAAAQVTSIGYVALPYAQRAQPGAGAVDAEPVLEEVVAEAPAGGLSLRERAVARARGHAGAAARIAAGGALPAARAGWKRAFVEDFIAPLKPRAIARWARRHGVTMAAPPDDAPLRVIQADTLPAGHGPATLYVLTAAIEFGARRHRVLLGAGAKAAVLGPRLWSRGRMAGVTGVLVAALLGGGWWTLRPGGSPAGVELAAAGADETAHGAAPAADEAASAGAEGLPAEDAAPAALHASGADAPGAGDGAAAGAADTPAAHGAPVGAVSPGEAASAEPVLTVHTTATDPAPAAPGEAPAGVATAGGAAHGTDSPGHGAPAPAPAPAARTAAPALAKNPIAGYPRRGRVELPDPRNLLDDEQKAAAIAEREALGLPRRPAMPRGAAPARAGAPSEAGMPAAAPAPPRPVPKVAPPPGAPAYAVSTRLLRTRTEADQVRVAMVALLAGVGADGAVVEVLPQGEDWRVVGWPFDNRADADKARALLASRGMRVEVVTF